MSRQRRTPVALSWRRTTVFI